MNIILKIERLILENNLGNKINNIDKVTIYTILQTSKYLIK